MPEGDCGSVKARWQDAKKASDALWNVVRPEALHQRPIPERHRLIFYLGHLEAFDWNLLAPALDLAPFHAEWDKLFAFGIDPVDGKLPNEPPEAWPAISEVGAYDRDVRKRLDAALERADNPELAVRLEVALEHRWMHIETLCYLFHNLSYAQKHPGPLPEAQTSIALHASPAAIPAGTATLGQPRNHHFGWDNEFDVHTVAVPAFAAGRRKVTNGEYLEFVKAGAEPPHFWRKRDDGWYYRGMFAEVSLPLNWPVFVTHSQAASYCDWKGVGLPTEAEWHRMAYATPGGDERSYPWGETPPAAAAGNFDLRAWDPVATGAFPASASAWGVEDLLGNGWEWTSTVFAPFPGFQPLDFYPGYSANFFDGQHYVLKGGSPRTAACLLRRSFRNWFQPNYPYLYAGFRTVAH